MYTLGEMSENLHTSLPIEYELQYGTACGYLNGPNFVGNTGVQPPVIAGVARRNGVASDFSELQALNTLSACCPYITP